MSSSYRPFLSLVTDTPETSDDLSWSTPWTAPPAGDDESWRLSALCGETDPEAFFPEKGGSTREAKRICQACAVRDDCLEYALEHDERFGIWGGLSDRERRRLKKQIG